MNKIKKWVISLLASTLIILSLWWAISETKEEKPAEFFVFHDQGELLWFELTILEDNIEGSLHHQKIIEEPGQVPVLEEKTYPIVGKVHEYGYEIIVNNGEEKTIYNAKKSNGNLFVQLQGNSEGELYKVASEQEIQESINELHEEFDYVMYHAEHKENERIRKFFDELQSAYGFLYTEEDQAFQLFIRIEEALLEGEVSGSLLMVTKKDDSFAEATYEWNGITDGLMIRMYTTVNGEETKLEGNFYGDGFSFDLSFWGSKNKVFFHAVTEDEYKKHSEEFKMIER